MVIQISNAKCKLGDSNMKIEKDVTQPFLQPRSHLFYNAMILIAGILTFVFIPLFILTPVQSKQFINNGRELQVMGDVLILILCFYGVLAAYYWFMTLLRLKNIGATHTMFVFFWIVLSGFLLPVTTGHGMLELGLAPTHWLNFSIVLILSIVLAVLSLSRYSKTVLVFLAVFLVVSIIPTLPRAFSQFEKQELGARPVSLSTQKNILLVGFDSLPGHVMKNILTSTPEFKQTFKDFTFYNNVAASAPSTFTSLRGIVYGNYDFSQWKEPAPVDYKNLYFNRNENVNFITSFKYNIYNKSGVKLAAGQYGKAEQRDQLVDLYTNVAARITSSYGVNLIMGLDNLLFAKRKGRFHYTVEGYDKVVDSFVAESEKPSVVYTHFAFTHLPFSLDENCVYRKMDRAWYYSHQNVDGIRAGGICGLKKYTELIDKLKRLGIYDQTMIVFLSDHGTAVSYHDKPPHNLKINNGPSNGFDRYQPFMMIKPIDQTNEVLQYSDKYIILDDLAQTNCNVFETTEFCEQRPGLNILDDADIAPDNFFIHIGKDKDSDWKDEHVAIPVSRKMNLLDALQESDQVTLSEP